jgi:hypothetical protein
MTILCNHRHIRSELGLSLNFFKISLIILVLSSTSVSQIILLKIDAKKILSEMGMRLNGEKTYHSDDIVNSSIKKDKLHQIIHNYQQQNGLKNQLLVIKNLA